MAEYREEIAIGLQAGLALAKVPLCLLIGCSALFGFFLADPIVSSRAFLAGLGLFLLACGAAVLNSLQEHQLDARFERTKDRPLPTGAVGRMFAVVLMVLMFGAGAIVITVVSENELTLVVSLVAVLLYNGIYTPLKQKTVWAMAPGALCGALVPYIGWLIGGGGWADFEALLLIITMVLWQVPHFWLVLLRYKKDYEGGAIPSLFTFFDEVTIRRFFVTWIGALVSVMILFATIPAMGSTVIRLLIVVNSILLLFGFLVSFTIHYCTNYRLLFGILNGSLLGHMTIVILGRIYT